MLEAVGRAKLDKVLHDLRDGSPMIYGPKGGTKYGYRGGGSKIDLDHFLSNMF